jgi:hypothetical protein
MFPEAEKPCAPPITPLRVQHNTDTTTHAKNITHTLQMVYCGVDSPYISLAHLVEGDYSGKHGGDYDAFGGYTRRRKYIDKIVTGIVIAGQHDDATAIYGEVQSCAQAHMVHNV